METISLNTKSNVFSRFGTVSFLFALIFVLGSGVRCISAQKPEYSFHRIHDGLVSNQVLSLHQDSYGFLWIGTNSGLNRYDGMNFVDYHSTSDPNSLPDNYISVLYEDSRGCLWVGTRGMISRYRRGTDDFERYELPAPSDRDDIPFYIIHSILEDDSGSLWVSGGRNGLYYLDKEQARFIPFEPLVTHTVYHILPDGDSTMWAATRGFGLQKINLKTGEAESFRHDPGDSCSIQSDIVGEVIRDFEGNIWIGSEEQGVSRIVRKEDGSICFKHYRNEPGQPPALGNNAVQAMYVDNDGNLWVGNDNGGLHLYDPEQDKFHHYTSDPLNPYSISHESVTTIFQDRDGRLWIGTALTGLNVSDRYRTKFQYYGKSASGDTGLNNDIVRAFLEDDYQNLWIATDGGGINYYDRSTGRFSAFPYESGRSGTLQSGATLTLRKDHEGYIWVGSYNGGLDRLTDPAGGRFDRFQDVFDYDFKAYPLLHVFDVHFDRDFPYIWIADFSNGIVRFNHETGETRRFLPVERDRTGLLSVYVRYFLPDSRGNLWISTMDGLNKLTLENKPEGIFKRFLPDDDDPDRFPGQEIRHIMEDSNGIIWVTSTNGLSRYNPDTGRFHTYRTEDGLPTNELRSVAEDENGDLWIGTVNGLAHFNPETETFVNYNRDDGLQSNEFSRFAAARLSTGEMVFGGMNGFNLFHPDHILSNPHAPEVYITGLRLFNRPVHPDDKDSPLVRHIIETDTLVLSYTQNVITFEFIALNFTLAEQNRFAYMLEGFETDWNDVGTQQNATYTNLNPGHYTFRVRASNNDGVWNEEGAAITVIVVPPFWQTYWFYILVGLVILAGILVFYRVKVWSMAKRNRELEAKVNERTAELQRTNVNLNASIAEKNKLYSVLAHDLRNPFVSIIGFSEYLDEKLSETGDEESRELIGSIRSAAGNTHELLENLLQWSNTRSEKLKVNIERCDLNTLVNEAIAVTESQAGLKKIDVKKAFDGHFPVFVDKNMILTVLRNLISNAVKFSKPGSEVVINVASEANQYVVSVRDSGVGMSPEETKNLFTTNAEEKKAGTMGEKGTGFGLMLCREFVARNKGEIRVESEKGKRSTFYFTLEKAETADAVVNE